MKGLFVWLLLLTFLPWTGSARAEEETIDLSAMQAVVDETDAKIDLTAVFRAITGNEEDFDPDKLLDQALKRMESALKTLLPSLTGLSGCVLLWALARQIVPRRGGYFTDFACAAFCALALIRLYVSALSVASGAVKQLTTLTDALVPVLVTMLVISGGTHTASLITPMGALISRLLALAVQRGALALCSVSAALAAASTMGGLKLERLGRLVTAGVKWLLRTAVGAYLALMATGGLISGAYDGALLKGARYAADHLLPIIGGEVSGMMDSLAASVTLLRGGTGITGAAALMAVCLTPVIHCGLLSLFCRFLAAATEPVGGEKSLKLLDAFSQVFAGLAATVAAAAALILILIGAALGMGQRIAG